MPKKNLATHMIALSVIGSLVILNLVFIFQYSHYAKQHRSSNSYSIAINLEQQLPSGTVACTDTYLAKLTVQDPLYKQSEGNHGGAQFYLEDLEQLVQTTIFEQYASGFIYCNEQQEFSIGTSIPSTAERITEELLAQNLYTTLQSTLLAESVQLLQVEVRNQTQPEERRAVFPTPPASQE